MIIKVFAPYYGLGRLRFIEKKGQEPLTTRTQATTTMAPSTRGSSNLYRLNTAQN